MSHTILDLDSLDTPWVLVGGQMTVLHCLEHGAPVHRATDDGDIVVGVWTRRDALNTTTAALRELGYTEQRTHDGYGYRFHRDQSTVVDVLLPEGMERQRHHPTTGSGRPGLATEGGRQALSRAERVPVEIHGRTGHVRRPTLLGALVAKAHARAVDSRDPDRHTEDIAVLAELALANPRAVLAPLRPSDRRALRRIRHRIDNRQLALTQDPVAVGNLLDQMAGV